VFANEKNHNHFIHRCHRSEQNKCTSRKKAILTSNDITNLCIQARIDPKHFDKLKPEPGPKSPARLTPLAGAGKFMGVRRIFAQIIPKYKLQKKVKTTAFYFILGVFFSNQSTSSTVFAQIFLNLPEKNKKITSKKTSAL